jgi:flagellar protein FliL
MADAPGSDDAAAEAPAAAPEKKSKLPMIVAAAVVALLAAGGGAYFFIGKKDPAEQDAKAAKAQQSAPKGPAIYVEFDPPFVVNFEARGAVRFLQISAQVMTRDPATAELVKTHDPVLRNDLLMLFGSQTYDLLSTREGKEQLRAQALQSVAKVVTSEGGNGKAVEQLYFTSFVMQ